MTITPSPLVADIVANAPATLAVFQRHGLEPCCGGSSVPLEEMCAHEGLDPAVLIEELREAAIPFSDTRDWRSAPLAEVIAHIQMAYHRPLYEELPRLGAMLERVVERHGNRHPDALGPLRASFRRLEGELTMHMRKEDAVLFPVIVALASQAGAVAADPHPLADPISVMERNHAQADEALATMRLVTSGYEPPADACLTFRGLYHGLSELERRMHLHIRLENDILFPRAVGLGRAGKAQG